MRPRRSRCNCACLLRLTWNRTGYSRISLSTRELSAWTSSVLFRERSADSNSRTGSNRSGPGQAWISATPHPGTLWAATGGRGTAIGIRRRPVHIRNSQSDVPGAGPALTGRRVKAGEATTRSICFWDTDPGVPEFG